MKAYTTYEVHKLITLINNYRGMEILSEIVLDNHEAYEDEDLLSLTKRIADKSIKIKVKK